jgi:hypothetical protein
MRGEHRHVQNTLQETGRTVSIAIRSARQDNEGQIIQLSANRASAAPPAFAPPAGDLRL